MGGSSENSQAIVMNLRSFRFCITDANAPPFSKVLRIVVEAEGASLQMIWREIWNIYDIALDCVVTTPVLVSHDVVPPPLLVSTAAPRRVRRLKLLLPLATKQDERLKHLSWLLSYARLVIPTLPEDVSICHQSLSGQVHEDTVLHQYVQSFCHGLWESQGSTSTLEDTDTVTLALDLYKVPLVCSDSLLIVVPVKGLLDDDGEVDGQESKENSVLNFCSCCGSTADHSGCSH